MGDTSIEWTEKTWNPLTGCSKVSPGCAHCYAETLALNRLAGKPGYPGLPWTPANAAVNVVLRPERLDQPLRWRKQAMIFVNSMSDLFHERVPAEFIAKVFAVMGAAGRMHGHIFQVLTKRPERMAELIASQEFERLVFRTIETFEPPKSVRHAWHRATLQGSFHAVHWPMPNVWLGTSIENRRFVARADRLRETPAAVRFISAEPLLGPLVWDGVEYQSHGDGGRPEPIPAERWEDGSREPDLDLTDIDWLIVGGESGARHRPIRQEWVTDLLCRCEEEGTAFFLKQMGGHRPGDKLEDLPEGLRIRQMPAVSSAGVS